MNAKTCTGCKRRKPLTAYHRDSYRADGRRSRCRECERVDPAGKEKRGELDAAAVDRFLVRPAPVPLHLRMNTKLRNIIARVEEAEGEPIRELLEDYAAQGYSRTFTAGCLDLNDKTLIRIADILGIKFVKDRARMNINWGSVEQAVEAAKRARVERHGIEYNGEKLSRREWSERLGGPSNLVACRLRRGWSIEDAVTIPPMRRGFTVRPAVRKARHIQAALAA